MKIVNTELEDVKVIEPTVHGDHRGYFMESYSQKVWDELGIKYNLVQDNESLSAAPGTLRGLHYQLNPKAQTKIVRCLSGAILDVVVDIRKGSPTYGKWISEIISSSNKRQIIVPKGFAHGIITLVPNTTIMYKVDEFYSPEHDRGIRWNDPALNINWGNSNPILSEKDENAPLLSEAEINFTYGE